MKKTLGLLIITASFFLLIQSAMAAEPIKIGVFNLQQCMMQSNEGQRIAKGLNEKISAMRKKMDAAQNELLEMQKDMEKQSLMLSLDAKEDKQKEYEKKRRDLGYLAQDLNEEAKKAEAEAQDQFLKGLEVILIDIAKSGNYDMIVEQIQGGVLFSSAKTNITAQVVEAYNKAKP